MAIIAGHPFVIPARMVEGETFGVELCKFGAVALGQDNVTLLAILERDGAAISRLMLVVVASGAAGPVLVADVVR